MTFVLRFSASINITVLTSPVHLQITCYHFASSDQLMFMILPCPAYKTGMKIKLLLANICLHKTRNYVAKEVII